MYSSIIDTDGQGVANLSSIYCAICVDHHSQRLKESITMRYFYFSILSCKSDSFGAGGLIHIFTGDLLFE